MPVIGQSFSPQFLSLLVQRGEGDKNRALEAALAERKLRQQDKQMSMAAQQGDIDNQFRAAMAKVGGSAGKAQIEAMKEEGRANRAAEANSLKDAIERAKIEQKRLDRERVRVPDVEGKNARRAAQNELTGEQAESERVLRPGEKAQQDAKTALYIKQAEKLQSEIKDIDRKLNEAGITFALRKQYLKLRNGNIANMITNRDEAIQLRKAADEVAEKLGNKRSQQNLIELEQAWLKMNTDFDRYNQSLQKRIGSMSTIERNAILEHKREVYRQIQDYRKDLYGGLPKPEPGSTAFKPPPAEGSAMDEAAKGYTNLPGSK